MFASAAPSGGLHLTLNLLPQSVLEGAFALALVVLLAVPLVARIHRLLEDAPKDSRNVRSIPGAKFESSRLEDRRMESLEAVPSDASLRLDFYEPEAKNAEKMRRAEARDNVDVAVFDYRAYRHRLMEEVLMKYYDERQPPGQVVMNSIHLNAQDDSKFHSKSRGDLFAYIDDVHEPVSRKDASYIHPLDHFLVKRQQRAPTEEKSIETRSPSLWSIPDIISETRLSSVKNEGELAVSTPRTSQHYRNRLETPTRADHRGRYEADERPNTATSKMPMKSPESKGQPKPFYRTHANLQPAEILRIDRDDCSSRPLTAGESSSDLCSSLYDAVESKRRRDRAGDAKNLKRPWLVSSHPDSYNRKYGKQLRESLFDARWRLRQSSPRRSNASPVAAAAAATDNCSSTASLLSAVSRSPSPSSNSRTTAPPTCQQNGSEVLQKVTLLSSSLEQSDPLKRSKLSLQEGNDSSKSQAPTGSLASSPSTPRRKVSRLPLHINSKKPIASKLPPSETDGRAKSEDKRPATISSSCERPKTTSGAISRAGAVSKLRNSTTNGETRETRPRTSDYSVVEASKTQKTDDEAGKKPVTWSVNVATKVKRKSRSKEVERSTANTNESDAYRKLDPSPHRARPRGRASRKNTRGEENARVKVAVNRGLKTYIEKLKIVLSERQQPDGNDNAVESAQLAGLSLVEAVTAEIEANLSAGEIHELRNILQSAERKLALGGEQAASNR